MNFTVIAIAQQLRNCVPLQYIDANLTSYVYSQLGDRCATPSIVTPTVVVYVTILALGLFGNVCTCLVIIRNKCMHTSTNYYLFNLAVADLLMLVLGLPMELYSVFSATYPYNFGEVICKLRAFLIEFTSYASILTITAFSVERWCAICFPLSVKIFSRLNRAVKVIITVWILAFIAALPVANIVIINRLPVPQFVSENQNLLSRVSNDNMTVINTEYCAMNFNRPEAQKRFIFMAFFLFFLLPAVLIIVLYAHIVLRLTSSDATLFRVKTSKIEKDNERHALPLRFLRSDPLRRSGNTINLREKTQLIDSDFPNQFSKGKKKLHSFDHFPYNDNTVIVHKALKTKSKRNTIKILYAVVVMFFLCWLPFHVQRLLTIFINEVADPDSPNTSAIHSIFNVVFYISGYFFYSNSACNPILYNILSQKYRKAFCKTIFGTRLANKIFTKASPLFASTRQQRHIDSGVILIVGKRSQSP